MNAEAEKWWSNTLDEIPQGPPCPMCSHWQPEEFHNFPDHVGWKFCHAKKMKRDFSCFDPMPE